jgi:hypothetical protein
MKKKSKQNKHKDASESQGPSYKSSLTGTMSFGFKHMFLALLVGLALGGFIGYQIASTHIQVTSGDGPTDSYGRSIGHPHYGHNHP